ncbi:hypothetical protein PHAVU_009G212800 [Phaseolus vulgaris]|uniref:K+ potassium transporter integral membrane domain-containing protein n=1 Tax=Phaseolus vulgaris TaxID=3885 RepID=V7B0R5_PHAVU|nr:hypothetical protein PHAVU_009G212800g [Phaseolus vulgaris]ESW10473.1 hypothetical protein PHAVU_009G212800g [Phaseolus vulgaris]
MSGAEGEAYGKKMKEEEVAAESGGRADAERKMKLKERKVSWSKLRRVDSLNLEAGRVSMVAQNSYEMGWRTTLCLAFQSIGVVYGDIGTSPLYVFSSIFTNGIIKHEDDILGVLSLIIYTITLLPFLKYVFIVLWANDNGNGGAFALYSLICRHMKMSLIPNEQPEDRELSNYRLETPSSQVKWVHKLKQKLEASLVSRVVLLFLAIVGTSMVIGDGILTPSISVLSAVSGISKSLGQVGIVFAPIILVWFFFIGGIGLYSLFKYDIRVLRAFYPKYIFDYFKRNGEDGWLSLGGVFLCITGSEALFADLGHFDVRSIQISFSCITYPTIVVAYIGQAAYLRKFPQNVANTFYACVPHPTSADKLNKCSYFKFTNAVIEPHLINTHL